MTRPLRIEFPGAVYHVTSRGNARQPIYQDVEDRTGFLALLEQVCRRYHWLCHAWCLMDNHYHLLIETPEGNLSVGMRQLNGLYTQRFNRRHSRVGHILQGRYKAILVDRDSYLLELSRYIVLNPVRAGLVTSAADTPWSSYRATAGLEACPPYLHSEWILAQFGSSREQAVERYRQFVSEGIGQRAPWDAVKGQLLLGSEAFVGQMSNHLHGKRQLDETPRTQRFADRPSLEAMRGELGNGLKAERNRRIRQAHLEYGYSLAAIGKVFGLHYSTVSKIVKAAGDG
jgi:REP element-mobilizing transposase RayT